MDTNVVFSRKQVIIVDKLDIKLWTLAARVHIVPDRSLLKTPAQIKKIKKSRIFLWNGLCI